MFDQVSQIPETYRHVAITIGGLVLLAVYYWTGTRYLGPDDDFWGPLRRTLLPRLDALVEQHGGYATNRAPASQQVAIVEAPPEEVERALYEQGYRWNFAAGLKTDPMGRTEYSSWARRQIQVAPVRRVFARLDGIRILGTSIELLEGALARRQDHATLFAVATERHGTGVTTVYAHEEPNALNPVLFVTHYLGGRVQDLLGNPVDPLSVEAGIRQVAHDLGAAGLPHRLTRRAEEVVDNDPTGGGRRGD